MSALDTHCLALLELNVQAFARTCRMVGVATILSTLGVGMGVNQPTTSSLRKELAGLPELDRSTMNAFRSSRTTASPPTPRKPYASASRRFLRGLNAD